jgi:hypothetical protein
MSAHNAGWVRAELRRLTYIHRLLDKIEADRVIPPPVAPSASVRADSPAHALPQSPQSPLI